MARQGPSLPYSGVSGPASVEPAVRDLWPRLVLNPLFGLVIPTVTRLVEPRTMSWPALIFSYVWFILVAFALWEGNRRIYLRFVRRCDWFATPWKRVIVIGGPTLLYTITTSTLLIWGWTLVAMPAHVGPARLAAAVAMTTACVVFVVHVYETVFLLRDWESDRVRGERLERERVEAELDALRHQLEPHFLFNALNSLSYLVEHDRDKALRFIDALGEVLRYIVTARGRASVALDEELTFIGHYMTLMRLRFGAGLALDVRIDPRSREEWQVLPASLQGLVENAVKHNDVTKVPSFVIAITMADGSLEVRSPLVPFAHAPKTTGTGLRNLAERSRLALGVPVTWADDGGEFVVRLPLRRDPQTAGASALGQTGTHHHRAPDRNRLDSAAVAPPGPWVPDPRRPDPPS